MIITIVQANVEEKNWSRLKDAFRNAGDRLPEGLSRTFLAQDAREKKSWRIISVWESREALEKMRDAEKTPAAVLIFRASGAEPEVSVCDVLLEKEAD